MRKKFYSRLAITTIMIIIIVVFIGYFEAIGIMKKTMSLSNLVPSNNILTITASKDLNISTHDDVLRKNTGNISSNSEVTVSLIPKDSYAKYKYSLYFEIEKNEFTYTTPEKTPELLLTVTDPNGKVLSNLDVTTSKDSILVVDNYIIESFNGEEVINNWSFKLSMQNLDTLQSANQNKEIIGRIVITKEDITEYNDNSFKILKTILNPINEESMKVDVVVSNPNEYVEYYYSLDNKTWIKDEDSHIFTGLVNNNKYHVYVKVITLDKELLNDLELDFNVVNVNLICKNCISDKNSIYTFADNAVSFKIIAASGYDLKNAVVLGDNCDLSNDILVASNNDHTRSCVIMVK